MSFFHKPKHRRTEMGEEPPTHAPQLPDFKPRRMSAWERALAWLMGFIVLLFVLAIAAHFILKTTPTHVTTPVVHHSVVVKPKPKATVCK